MAKKRGYMQRETSMQNDKPSEDMGNGQFANMPQSVTMKPWPKYGEGNDEGLEDTIVGIDAQVKDTQSKMSRNHSKSMY